MGLLEGKKIVITGVLTDASLAFGVARIALDEGAEIVLTGAGRALSLTQRTARKLGDGIDVFEFDVTVPEHGPLVRDALAAKWGHVDGVLHAIGFAPASCLGDDFLGAPWDDVAVAMQISTYSLKTLVDTFLPLMGQGGSFVGLDFDNSQAWPAYNWMGVAKSALQSVSRYLAKELGPKGIRSNLVAAGPIKTMAAKSIPGFALFEDSLGRPRTARLGRHRLRTRSPRPASPCCRTGSPPRPARSSTSTADSTSDRRLNSRHPSRQVVARSRRTTVNRLADETSPYLRQHRDNPVDWYPWGPEAFAAAQERNVPILLSVGYSACHWCHVMAHECFEDAEVADADERAVRQRQGRPRGAARRRRRLHGRGAGDDRARRLADDGVHDARPRAVLRRHLLPEGRSSSR